MSQWLAANAFLFAMAALVSCLMVTAKTVVGWFGLDQASEGRALALATIASIVLVGFIARAALKRLAR